MGNCWEGNGRKGKGKRKSGGYREGVIIVMFVCCCYFCAHACMFML